MLARRRRRSARVGRQAEDRHDFRSDRDVEAIFAREAIGHAAERADDRAQGPVVHVEAAPPADTPRVDRRFAAPIDVVVDHRSEQVVGGADRVQVAGKVQVDVLHRHDLGIAAAGGAALDAEARPEARLAQAQDRLLADMVERVAETDRRRRLALAGRGRGDRGDEDQPAVRAVGQRADIVERNLGLVAAIGREGIVRDAEFVGRHLADRLHRRRLSDIDVGFRVAMLLVSARHGDPPWLKGWRGLSPHGRSLQPL